MSLPLLAWAYGLWTHGELELDTRLLAGLLAGILLANAGSFMTTYLGGINHVRAVLAIAMLRGLVSLIVAWLLLPKIGLAAAGVGIMGAEALCFMALAGHYFPQALRHVGSSEASFATSGWSMAGLLATLALIGTSAVLGHIPIIPLLLAMALVITSSWQGWKLLDVEVRQRLCVLGARIVFFDRAG